MSERRANMAFVGSLVILAGLLIALVVTGETPDDRVERIGQSIKCPVCQGESIADSPATMATDMMALVSERVDRGASDEEIVEELLASFSGAVLLDPPTSGATLALWLAPLLALVVGVVVVLWWKRHPGDSSPQISEVSTRNRRLIGGLILIGGFALTVVIAGAFLQDRPDASAGVADLDVENLEDVSNETMEAVINANLDNPQINGMRLALAERYFEDGDYRSAFPHFLAVAQDADATDLEASSALIRLGWMAYDGNGEVDTATDLLDQALAINPGSPVALYLKGQVVWCGRGDNAAASDLFRQVLNTPDLAADTEAQVRQDLDLASSGAACT